MDTQQLEEIGEHLRSLGHERREAVERIVADTSTGNDRVVQHFKDLDRISEQAINLMEKQRSMIREELTQRGPM
ncbi:MAG: hypothetical protein ACM3XM_05935 [Mycobacterium leprae]